MADDGYYSSEYSSDTFSSTEQPSPNRCREILSHGTLIHVSSCRNPDFYTTTIDGRCYNCGGMGRGERDRLYDRDRYRESRGDEGDGYGYERARKSDSERRRESHRGNAGYGQSYSLSGRETQYSSSSPPRKERGYEQGGRRTSVASSSRGDACCDSPNFWTTTRDGSCYNCGGGACG